ncbi:condensation domain-containing protein [Micromonospora sp. HUAS LYJ1]|uniref:condensation domain-containing protein n=1 Tax=Micromonospora sp. HUAS LYJ1 TaxID=3061626 RepID=UPI002671E1C1|nr:condensation domain-containing protein [Micromonospora sp. HUAS LYJ1]WKU03370.1 condensation domain-containing protein [Micromonospora sp. HUAS LYJ1]
MQQIPFSDLEVAPGHIYEWQLCAPENLDPAHLGEKAASFNQEKHFSAALSARREHASEDYWIAITFKIPGRVDLHALESALRHFVEQHEVLRCGFEHLAGALRCDVMPPGDVNLHYVDSGEMPTSDAALNHLKAVFDQEISTLSWPLFRMGAVVSADHSTVFLAFDHIVCDGVSLAVAVNQIQSAYADATAGRQLPFKVVGSYLDFAQAQRVKYSGIASDGPELEYWRSFVAESGSLFPQIPLDLGIESGRMYPAYSATVQLLDDEDSKAFENLCFRHNGKLFLGLLAAVGVALRKVSGATSYYGFIPVSERRDPQWHESFGWFVNTLPIAFSVSSDLSFPEVLHAAQESFRSLIKSVDVPFVKAWELLAPQHYHLRTWPYPVNFFSFIDYRRMPSSEQYHIWRPSTIPNASHTNTGNMWFYRNSSGVSLNCIMPDLPQCRQAMAAYRSAIAATLTEVLHAAD